jgi:hypothetical protein
MHATRDTSDVIERNHVGGRVMRGVRLLMRYSPFADRTRGRGGWRSRQLEAAPVMMCGLTLEGAGGGGHGAGRRVPHAERVARGGLKMTPSNKRMHATRDTSHVIKRKLAGGRVMRSVMLLYGINREGFIET